MNIKLNQLKSKPKQIGELDGQPVLQAETKGGLFILMSKTASGKPQTLGTGSHPAVAQHIAERDFPKLKVTELSKSEDLDPSDLRAEVPYFSQLTKRIREIE